jgi:hypothetical protein
MSTLKKCLYIINLLERKGPLSLKKSMIISAIRRCTTGRFRRGRSRAAHPRVPAGTGNGRRLGYLFELAFADRTISKAEIDIIYRIGKEYLDLTEGKNSRLFAEKTQEDFVPDFRAMC